MDACGSGDTPAPSGETLNTDPFVNLHLHTEYSFLDGLSTLDQLSRRIQELNQTACAITDHGNVGGHYKWNKTARANGIKPIFGMEGYFCDDRFNKKVIDKESGKERTGRKGEQYYHMVLLAMDQKGLENLWTLSTRAYMEGLHQGDPRMDWELLEQYSDGLIVTGGCLSGAIGAFLNPQRGQRYDEAAQRAARLQSIFDDRFLLELHTFQDDVQKEANQATVSLSKELGIKTIVVTDAHYSQPEEWEDHEHMLAINTNKVIDDPTRYTYGYGQLCPLSSVDIFHRLDYLDQEVVLDSIAYTADIAANCNVDIEDRESRPVFFASAEEDSKKLWDAAIDGFSKRVPKAASKSNATLEEYEEALNKEMDVVTQHGFAGYFHIVADLIQWCKSEGILIGPGRGSVSGSILAYLMGITEIDPLREGLYFERFMNPGRIEMPDIDIDIPQHERGRVKERFEQMHGKENVATIGTIARNKPKALWRKLCSAFQVPYSDMDTVIKIIDKTPDLEVAHIDTPWSMIEEMFSADLAPYKAEYPRLFELMDKLDLHISNAGAHAAGVVVDKESLIGRLPLLYDKKNDEIRTQFEADDVEKLGFVKMDFLGLRNLSTLQIAMEYLQERGDDVAHYYDWQFRDDYYEDGEVYQSIWAGNNLGIFQLESASFREHVKWFKPEHLRDVVDLITVNRPGNTRAVDAATGKKLIDLYREKRAGRYPVTYKHPKLKAMLEPTLGQFFYQEDIIRAARELAGYSLSDADSLRKILGKKLVDKMMDEREKFINGCKTHSDIDKPLAKEIFDEIEASALYTFNLAHALAYAEVAHWTMYMKNHYPQVFMYALLSTVKKIDEQQVYLRECRRMGVKVLPPDINISEEGFTVDAVADALRFGITSIKGVGQNVMALKEYRPFHSVADFVERVPGNKVNKTAMETMIRVGCFDSLQPDRLQALREYWDARSGSYIALPKGKGKMAAKNAGLVLDFSHDAPSVFAEEFFELPAWEREAVAQMTNFEWYANKWSWDIIDIERELLGASVSIDPLENYLKDILAWETGFDEMEMFKGEKANLGGMVEDITQVNTKKGAKMGFLHLGLPAQSKNEADSVRVAVFPAQWSWFKDKAAQGDVCLVTVEHTGKGVCLQRYDKIEV